VFDIIREVAGRMVCGVVGHRKHRTVSFDKRGVGAMVECARCGVRVGVEGGPVRVKAYPDEFVVTSTREGIDVVEDDGRAATVRISRPVYRLMAGQAAADPDDDDPAVAEVNWPDGDG
jgi:hypothetical protein